MNKSKIRKLDAIIIIIILTLYMIGYAWMIEPKKKSYKKDDVVTHQIMSPRPSVEPKNLKSLAPEWPEDLGKFFYFPTTRHGRRSQIIILRPRSSCGQR